MTDNDPRDEATPSERSPWPTHDDDGVPYVRIAHPVRTGIGLAVGFAIVALVVSVVLELLGASESAGGGHQGQTSA